MTTIKLDFTELFQPDLKDNKKALVNGIYAVFSCTDNPFKVKELLYIGQAQDQTIKERHSKHEDLQKWEQKCSKGERLTYAFCQVEKKYIDDVEAILIKCNDPVCNEQHPDIKDKNLKLEISGCCKEIVKTN